MGTPTHRLNDGNLIPQLGLGTYLLTGQAGRDAIAQAIRLGYRLIDTAFNYENEGVVGAAIRQAGLPREELFVTSKLPGRHHRHDLAVKSVEESLARLGLDYLDLHLIHWPNPPLGLYVEAWQALVECRERGLVRSIGVCNFLPEHLDRIIAATGVAPAVNQIQRHPYLPQDDQLAANASRGVLVEAWSPLYRGGVLADVPAVAAVAASHGKTPAQAVLRWHIQSGVVPIPKSADPRRQAENLAVFDFELTPEDMSALGSFPDPAKTVVAESPEVHVEL
ncbi:MAG: aldo/keto reductase [Propionibacteriaceae bacterium]|jgi:diketogulonate reductase-like aldo/keto reductase|nr:aldo/keto reductase [Propionibacteriaceae bacterium]